MSVRFVSDAELARLSSWPDEVAVDDLVTYFTLTSHDLGWLGANVRVENRLALFDDLGAPDKRLLAYPGLHTATPPGAEREWTEFVVTHLTDRTHDDP